MIHLRILAATDRAEAVLDVLEDEPAVTGLVRFPGASLRPPGDVIEADLPREVTDGVLERLQDTGVQVEGAVQVEAVTTWISRPGLTAEEDAEGYSADSVIWPDVVQRAYEETELNWVFLSFLTMATLLAAIAVVVDSQVLVIGAMVLGPEFGAIAALGLALVRRRYVLLRRGAVTLLVGFFVAIALTTVAALLARGLGWISLQDVVGPRPETDFIYSPDRWSFVVAVIAAAAGVLSMTSAKVSGISGVFISVTTVPAAGNVALGLAFGAFGEVRGSALQLVLNVAGMALAGWLTLALQHAVWSRLSAKRALSLRRRSPHHPDARADRVM